MTTATEEETKPATGQRKYAPKSKGGCITCRSRHVRCDQTRPRCAQCRKSSWQCAYRNPSASPSGSNSSDRVDAAIKVVFYEPSKRTRPMLNHPRLSQQPGQSSQGRRALRYFRDVVAERITGYFDASFWTDAAMRVATSTAPLRQAIVALASHWENAVVPGMHQRSTVDWKWDDFALKQYTLAISEMRSSMDSGSGGKPSTVEMLLCNLLFICLEMFQNHYEGALQQLSCGLHLFCEWHAGGRDGTDGDVETQLSHIFNRLMTQSLLFPLRRLDKRLLVPTLTPKAPHVPEKFDTPDQARDSFNDCMGSILHGVKSRDLPCQRGCVDGANFLTKWSTAFAELRARDENKLSELERRNCVFLEMQRLAVYLWALESASFASEMAFDEWTPDFSRLVKLGEYLVETKY